MSLTDVVSLGPVRIPLVLFAAVFAVLLFAVVFRLAFSRAKDEARRWEDRVANAAFVGFVLWKLSPVVDSWATVSRDPVTLLYLPGTWWGLAAGVLLPLAWLGWHVGRDTEGRERVLKALALAGAGAAAGLLVFVLGLSLVPAPPKPVTTDAPLVLASLAGPSQDLTSAPGKVLFVNFWATWCPPCRAEIPDFVEFWAQADKSRVAIHAVDLTTTEKDVSLVAPFVRDQGMLFPILMDTEGRAAARYQIESIPTTLVFDPAGKLVHRQVGVMTKDQMERLVNFYGNP